MPAGRLRPCFIYCVIGRREIRRMVDNCGQRWLSHYVSPDTEDIFPRLSVPPPVLAKCTDMISNHKHGVQARMLKSPIIVVAALLFLAGEARLPMAAEVLILAQNAQQQPSEAETGILPAPHESTTSRALYGPPTPPEVRSEDWMLQFYGPILHVAPNFLKTQIQENDARDRD